MCAPSTAQAEVLRLFATSNLLICGQHGSGKTHALRLILERYFPLGDVLYSQNSIDAPPRNSADVLVYEEGASVRAVISSLKRTGARTVMMAIRHPGDMHSMNEALQKAFSKAEPFGGIRVVGTTCNNASTSEHPDYQLRTSDKKGQNQSNAEF